MNKDLSQIEFYFPNEEFKNKDELVNSIISLMKEKGSIDYSGYTNNELLRQGLLDHIGNGSIGQYKSISVEQKSEIEKIISETVEKCNDKLPIPTKNFIFVHPYLTTEDNKVFEGVMAIAIYSCVFHLFVNLNEYSKKSIENTVAHELNHTIYYYNHYNDFNNYTLLDEILLEGLAENFREQYFDPEVSKWAGALNKDTAFDILRESKNILESRDQKVIKEFLFGNDKYEKWTGYSLGYWLVKKFIKSNPNLSWDEIMKIDSQKFLSTLHLS
ncbi:MAG: DUF2268 domain-containing putative Zn-dependent protease [Candidatus Paceibacterota bacterium]